jgi:hypothetical protein
MYCALYNICIKHTYFKKITNIITIPKPNVCHLQQSGLDHARLISNVWNTVYLDGINPRVPLLVMVSQ